MHPVFHLPEIILEIVQHLSDIELRTCSLVCKVWYANFTPFIWSTVSLPELTLSTSDISDKEAILRKHIHYVRHLHWPCLASSPRNIPLVRVVVEECRPQLLSIIVTIARLQDLEKLIELIRANPSIQTLHFHVISDGSKFLRSLHLVLPHMFDSLPKLRDLELFCGALIAPYLVCLLAPLQLLTSLTINICAVDRYTFSDFVSSFTLPSSQSSPSPPLLAANPYVIFPKLQSLQQLRIKTARLGEDIVWFLEQCPNLKQLHIESLINWRYPHEAVEKLRVNLPRLQSCTLGVAESMNFGNYFDPKAFLHVLLIPKLRTLRIDIEYLDEVAFICEKYAHTLEHLAIWMSLRDDGHDTVLRMILTHCRLLKSLTVYAVKTIDIRTLLQCDQPWVCTQLKALRVPAVLDRRRHIPFSVRNMRVKSDSDNDNHSHSSSIVETEGQENDKDMFGPQHWVEAEQLFMQRLGDLIHLRELGLGAEDCKDIPTKDYTCLTWSLANGLDHLRGLSKLQWLVRGRGRFLQDVKDLEWMKRHWPNLREMTCVPLDDGMQQWFKEHMPSLKIIMLSPRRPSYVFTPGDLSEEDSYQGEEDSYQSEDDIDLSEEDIDLSEEDSDMSEEDIDLSGEDSDMSEEDIDMGEEDSDQSEEDSDY